MKSKKLYQRINKIIKKKGYKELNLNPVLDINYVRDEKLKKYLFTFKDNKKNKIFALKPDLSLMSLIEFSKKKNARSLNPSKPYRHPSEIDETLRAPQAYLTM